MDTRYHLHSLFQEQKQRYGNWVCFRHHV